MNCASCDICLYHLGLCVCFLGVFLSSRVTGPLPVTTDLIMRVNVRTTTTTTFLLLPVAASLRRGGRVGSYVVRQAWSPTIERHFSQLQWSGNA